MDTARRDRYMAYWVSFEGLKELYTTDFVVKRHRMALPTSYRRLSLYTPSHPASSQGHNIL